MIREVDKTLSYFKGIRSNIWMMNIPPAHYESHLFNFVNLYADDNEDFWKKLRELTETMLLMDVARCPRFVFLCGQAGGGKTHYMVGLYRAMLNKLKIANGGGVTFSVFMTMIADIIAGFSDNIPIRDALSFYTQNKWVFLDDFTATEKVFKKDTMENQIFKDLFINRWDSAKTLVTTTNLEADVLLQTFDELYGDHIGSRISDSVIIRFPDDDLRKQGFGGHKMRRTI